MARINIEDSLFKDSRYEELLLRTGCKYKTLGFLTKAWIIAQTHWLKHKSVPSLAWPKELEILIEVEFARRNDDGSVYVKGSKKAFKWLEARSKGGQSKSNKKIDQLKDARKKITKTGKLSELELNKTELELNKTEALSLPLSLSLPHSQEVVVVNEESNHRRNNSVQNFENRFGKEWGLIFDSLKKLDLKNMRVYQSEILREFVTHEKFMSFIESLAARKKLNKDSISKSEMRGYLFNAIKSECGIV